MKKLNWEIDLTGILFFCILFLSGFERFDSDFLPLPIEYTFPVSILIDKNRTLIGIVLAIFFISLFLKITNQKKTSSIYIYPLIAFNCFLSIKMLFQDNEIWYRNILGAIVLYGIFRVCQEFSNRSNIFPILKRIVVMTTAIWLLVVTYMYLTGGDASIAWYDRYFFFSSHMNHAGAVWAMSSLFMTCILLFDDGENRWLILPLLAISLTFLVLTGSRGSMISWLCGLLVAVKYSNIKISTVVLFITPLLLILAFQNQENILGFFTGQVERGNTRDVVYAIAIEDFLNNLAIGAPIPDGRAVYVENTILAFLQLGGLVGFVLCIFFYAPIIHLLFSTLRQGTLRADAATMLSLLTCAVVASMFEGFPLNFVSAGLLMMLLPLSFFSKK